MPHLTTQIRYFFVSAKGGDMVLENQQTNGEQPESLLLIVSFLMCQFASLEEYIDKFGFVAQSLGLVWQEKN